MEAAKGVGSFLFTRALIAITQKLENDVVDTKIKDLIRSDIETIKRSLNQLINKDLFSCVDHLSIGINLLFSVKREDAESDKDDKYSGALKHFELAQEKAIDAMNSVTDVNYLVDATRVYCLSALYAVMCKGDGHSWNPAMISCVNRLTSLFNHPQVKQPLQVTHKVGISNRFRNLLATNERGKLIQSIYSNVATLALLFMGKGGLDWPYVKLSESVEKHSVVYLQKGGLEKDPDLQDNKYFCRNYPPGGGVIELIDQKDGSLHETPTTGTDRDPVLSRGFLVSFKSSGGEHPLLQEAEIRKANDLQQVLATLNFDDRYENAELPAYSFPTAAVSGGGELGPGSLVCVGTWAGHLSLWNLTTQRCVWDVQLKRISRRYQVREIRFVKDQYIVLTLNSKGNDKYYTIDTGITSNGEANI